MGSLCSLPPTAWHRPARGPGVIPAVDEAKKQPAEWRAVLLRGSAGDGPRPRLLDEGDYLPSLRLDDGDPIADMDVAIGLVLGMLGHDHVGHRSELDRIGHRDTNGHIAIPGRARHVIGRDIGVELGSDFRLYDERIGESHRTADAKHRS